jgi:hypothetical protein
VVRDTVATLAVNRVTVRTLADRQAAEEVVIVEPGFTDPVPLA